MMESVIQRLAGWDIHGFHTLEDLDIVKTKEEALTRWLRPNEIYAILCNCVYFKVNVKPVELPQSGTIILYDRKMLRNFRKDGHNWKKKKDGKTVKEAHEHLKVGYQDRIHVYYAHGQDNPNFVRRIYWLLEKKLEHIVLVHYREVSEDNATSCLVPPNECKEALSLSNRMHHGAPLTPVNSHSGSIHSETSGSRVVSEEINSGIDHAFHAGTSLVGESTEFGSQLDESLIVTDHEQRLREINTLDWADLFEANRNPNSAEPGNGEISFFDLQRPYGLSDSRSHDHFLPCHNSSSLGNPSIDINGSGYLSAIQPNNGYFQPVGDQNVQPSVFETIDTNLLKKDAGMATVGAVETSEMFDKNPLLSQDSFTRWMSIIENDSPGSVDELPMECSISTVNGSVATMVKDESSLQEAFSITEVSPAWAFSTEETKVIVIGYFHEAHAYLAESNLFCVFGDVSVPAERVQVGVFRCMALPCRAGLVDFYLSLDGHRPISQVLSFEYRPVSTNQMSNEISLLEDEKSKWRDLQLQIRLAHLIFSTTNNVATLSSDIPPDVLKEAKKFRVLAPSYEKDWTKFVDLIMNKEMSFAEAHQNFFELTLKSKLQEWLLERVAEGCKTTPRDCKGQGVIHLCAMLGYTWAVYLFKLSGLSLDFRDSSGWTALHWAAYYGREQMVAFLLSAGANPSLVSHPTAKYPGGNTAADLASMKGYDGLAAYLAEKGLTAHFNAMCTAGNVSGSLRTTATTMEQPENLNEEEQLLRDSLAAYRSAADAAARIQTALREHALKVRTKVVQLENTETEALNIISAMKIQHAYRNYHSRKRLAAAVRIQHRFRTWKIRKDFLNMRHQAIRIQAAFRGHLVRRQYHKILWSVGVLEKAILRWRKKRKGLRGLPAEPAIASGAEEVQEDDVEEDFYQLSRKQAEERVERSVVRVQAMFRSHQAQKEYRRMKIAFDQAKFEYEGLFIESE
ncbi:calmodulin-binding transcription activator 5 isoform X2 [Cinnamomum micranthum f. kanehirae]|uniref:Calmodulin-binding transcription activator 5 isoform X2 n=1 Tax=Cinnamomum micranthum f. kanehirae TaxID=337451 RepID=A0A3S3R6I7_9MAGN|nr:calmodulin-binding transcription activator 5 isoform X2 [Cinnamomum micranthum f. kanehirae]